MSWMSKKIFIYFGDNLFEKFKNISLDCNFKKFSSSENKVFNSLNSPFLCNIDDVYIGWSYAFFKTGHQLFYQGFRADEHSDWEVCTSQNEVVSDISCGLDKFVISTNSGNSYFYFTKDFKCQKLNFSVSCVIVRNVSTTDTNILTLSEDGKVFITDYNDVTSTVYLPMPCKITEVACGKEHVLLLSNSGQVFSYGSGSRGQLGHGNIETVKNALLIEALDGIILKTIAAGGWHSATISTDGILYVWGWNESGQLGFPCNQLNEDSKSKNVVETICCFPKVIELEDDLNVTHVACGSRHTAAITENHQLWTWGWNGYGQLGHTDLPICDVPKKVFLPDSITSNSIKCNFWSTLISASLKI